MPLFSMINFSNFLRWSFYKNSVTLNGFLIVCFAAIFAGYFFLGTAPHRNLMYIGIPFMLAFLYRNRAEFTFGNFILPIFSSVIAYFFINYLSILWSDPENIAKLLQRGKMLVFFPLVLFSFMFFHKLSPSFWKICLSIFAAAAVVTAAGLIVIRWDLIAGGGRLYGWGRAENPVQCGLLYGLAFLILVYCKDSLYFYKSWPDFARISLSVLPLTVLILSKSRGPFIACLFLWVVVAMLRSASIKEFIRKQAVPVVIITLVSISAFLYYGYSYVEHRGSTGRTQIWEQALSHALEKPFFGQGIATKFEYPFTYQGISSTVGHPHSVYISALVHTGFVGLLLQLMAALSGLYFSILRLKRDGDAAPFIFLGFGAVMGFVDFGGYYTNLGSTWLVFWFPLALLSMKRAAFQSGEKSQPV